MQSDLIYDVGLFDGTDTAYYLSRGYKVVAIDANPQMVENAKKRFSREICSGQLTALNVGISKEPGTATFWVSDVPAWSSFDRSIASRHGTPCREVSMPTVPFSQLLSQYGTPHYLKIDIEGHDQLCVDALNGDVPKFISVESECMGDTSLSEKEALSVVNSLRNAGYKKFKLVNQNNRYSVRSNPATALAMKFVNSAAYGRLGKFGLSKIADRFTDATRIAKLGASLDMDSSGPWGNDIPGNWMTFEKAKSLYLQTRRAYFLKNNDGFWYDWHAAA